MPLEKVRLLSNKAKSLVETFDYLYTVIVRTGGIENLDFTVAENVLWKILESQGPSTLLLR